MAGSFSNFLENKLLDQLLGGVAYTFPATIYIGLATAISGDGTTFTEVSTSGTGYARITVTANQTNFPAAVSGSTSNGVAFSFPTATTAWGTIVAFGVFDSGTVGSGNLLLWGDIVVSGVPTPKAIGAGDTASFGINGLTVTLD